MEAGWQDVYDGSEREREREREGGMCGVECLACCA